MVAFLKDENNLKTFEILITGVNVGASTLQFTLLLVSMFRFGYYARKHYYDLYRHYRISFILESIFIMLGIICAVWFSVLML